jgi:hypothetical protein
MLLLIPLNFAIYKKILKSLPLCWSTCHSAPCCSRRETCCKEKNNYVFSCPAISFFPALCWDQQCNFLPAPAFYTSGGSDTRAEKEYLTSLFWCYKASSFLLSYKASFLLCYKASFLLIQDLLSLMLQASFLLCHTATFLLCYKASFLL